MNVIEDNIAKMSLKRETVSNNNPSQKSVVLEYYECD